MEPKQTPTKNIKLLEGNKYSTAFPEGHILQCNPKDSLNTC